MTATYVDINNNIERGVDHTAMTSTSSPTSVVAREEAPPPKYVSSQKRCAEYSPSLEELKDTTFEEYVRGEILGVPLPGYEFLYVYEDKDGREMKREVPVGQQYAGGGEDTELVAQAVTSSDESSSRSTPPPTKKQDEARTTRSQSQAKRGTSSKNSIPSPEPPHERYRMCFHKLRDGMAKVTLPTGFWAKTDTTARGRLVSVLLPCICFNIFLKNRSLTPSLIFNSYSRNFV